MLYMMKKKSYTGKSKSISTLLTHGFGEVLLMLTFSLNVGLNLNVSGLGWFRNNFKSDLFDFPKESLRDFEVKNEIFNF